jgi:hypothetical protein
VRSVEEGTTAGDRKIGDWIYANGVERKCQFFGMRLLAKHPILVTRIAWLQGIEGATQKKSRNRRNRLSLL